MRVHEVRSAVIREHALLFFENSRGRHEVVPTHFFELIIEVQASADVITMEVRRVSTKNKENKLEKGNSIKTNCHPSFAWNFEDRK